MSLEFEIAIESAVAKDHLQVIRDFYQTVGYPGPTEPEDEVVLAWLGKELVGVARLVQEHGYHLLRGMYLREDCRKHGIGRCMLKKFEQLLDRGHVTEIYLTCGPHLTNFYGKIGFHRAGPSVSPPAFLEARRGTYVARYGEQIIMYRIAP